MRLADVAAEAARDRLAVFGGFHPQPEDGAPDGTATLLLLGPAEPGFWAGFTASPEWSGGRPDPLDRWSERVIGGLAATFGATALFPFGGPPYRPFQKWAVRSGRAWVSPVGLLVHDTAGLWVSYRGALALPQRLDLPATGDSPCATCAGQPCRSACPVAAFSPEGYDFSSCHTYLDSEAGRDCMAAGCRTRRACPAGAQYDRQAEQSAYHMKEFHP